MVRIAEVRHGGLNRPFFGMFVSSSIPSMSSIKEITCLKINFRFSVNNCGCLREKNTEIYSKLPIVM